MIYYKEKRDLAVGLGAHIAKKEKAPVETGPGLCSLVFG